MSVEISLAETLVAPLTRDEKTASVVSSMTKISGYAVMGILLLLIVWVLRNFIKGGIANGLFALIFSFFLAGGVFWFVSIFVLAPISSVRFSSCIKSIQTSLPQLGVSPTMQYSWKSPSPGLIAIDMRNYLVFIESEGTNYHRILLKPEQIIGAKVERETEMHTQTKHSGGMSVFSRGGLGYTFGGHSSSKTSVIERAFLEVHYSISPDVAPSWVAVPFQSQRREAESMAVAIMQMKGFA